MVVTSFCFHCAIATCVNCVFKNDERRGAHLQHGNQTNGVTCFLKGTFYLTLSGPSEAFGPGAENQLTNDVGN